MYYPDKKTFMKLSKKGNVIPVYHEMLADFDTPLSAFLKIDEGDHSFLLESVENGDNLGRYSFLGSDPSLIIQSKGNVITVTESGKAKDFDIEKDPLEKVQEYLQGYKYVNLESLPRFAGGFIGYLGYDMVRFFEKIPDNNPEKVDIPDMHFVLTDTLLIFDHVDRKIKVVSNAFIKGDPEKAYNDACVKIDKLIERLKQPVELPVSTPVHETESSEPGSNYSKQEFMDVVDKAKEHIKAGDIIQVVLSQRISKKTKADAFDIYRALRSINPSPYMFYLKFGKYKMVGSSPEILVRCENGLVEVRPIAGTRKRGETPEEDKALEKELLDDPKERAEHIMLVDLGRNDIGRVCDYKSVKPRDLMVIEKYSHVMHIVSDVIGTLNDDKDIFDVIRSTFPAGTVTGAPKVKAMELIDKFENVRRGVYAGCLGYISFSNNLDMCITIRTILMDGDNAHIQAGAGIVLDSDPENEYHETLNKAGAMMKAIEFAERGLE